MTYEEFGDPPLASFLFNDTRIARLWLIVRLCVGYEWLMAGWGKVTSDLWTGAGAGVALSGFVNGALAKTVGAHPDVQGWYAWFLQAAVLPHAAVWSYVVAYGEVVIGIALIAGIFVGVAAFFGAFMNFNFLLAGTVSINPLLFVCEIGLILAWKVAGHIGADRYLLPILGTPWRPGKIFHTS